jgi:hypothetical protein
MITMREVEIITSSWLSLENNSIPIFPARKISSILEKRIRITYMSTSRVQPHQILAKVKNKE